MQEVEEYGYSFWFRFSYLFASRRVETAVVRDNLQGIAGITEQNEYCTNDVMGHRSLALFFNSFNASPNPQMLLSTYDLNSDRPNIEKTLLFSRKDLDTRWTYVSFYYSLKLQKAFAYFRFGYTKQMETHTFENIKHFDPINQLTFKLGNCKHGEVAMNGHYFGIRFNYGKGFFTDKAIDIFNTYTQLPYPPLLMRILWPERKKYHGYFEEFAYTDYDYVTATQ